MQHDDAPPEVPPRDAASAPAASGPLTGLRVLELGQLVAGAFCSHMLAMFGADVIKVEPPSGDPLRSWRQRLGDTSLWWWTLARNKRCITLDLGHPDGREIVRRMIASGTIDVLVENFRPGRLEAWGLGPQQLHALSPGLVIVRISGYGQTGPLAPRPGFANVAEAYGGLRHVTGDPDRPPSRSAISLGDTAAGLHGAFAALAALRHRDRTGHGQVCDVALTESVLNLMESLLPEADALGHVRQRSGARLDGVVPSNTYRCRDGLDVAIGANTERMFVQLMRRIGRHDLADDPTLAGNHGRVARAADIDAAVAQWCGAHERDAVVDALLADEIAVGPVLDAAALLREPQLHARGMVERHDVPAATRAADPRAPATIAMPGPIPRLEATPGATRWLGPALGAHTDQVLNELLGADAAAIRAWRERGALGPTPEVVRPEPSEASPLRPARDGGG